MACDPPNGRLAGEGMIGTTIGRFRIVEKIDEGAMASVWKAEDPLLRRSVALKLLHASHLRSPRARQRFLREARLAAELERHPGVAPVFDAGECGESLYIA